MGGTAKLELIKTGKARVSERAAKLKELETPLKELEARVASLLSMCV
jgi:hypothetical protein